MPPQQPDGLTFTNADLGKGALSSLRIDQGRITALGQPPQPDDIVVDLHGERVLPGLINAHDHLQFNNFPHLAYDTPYRNAREWILDVNARAQTDRQFAASGAVSREHRLLAGGFKNLLSGVTTVAHHDPLYPTLTDDRFPIRLVTNYGWSHSLSIDGEQSVQRAHRQTPADQPWIIHAAEGVDDEATEEFARLDALGCIGPNTLLVHGVALEGPQRDRLERAGAALIWCPTSNLRMFARTADIAELLAHGHLALGTDSRLTGARDLLDELHVAAAITGADEQTLEALVTRDNARWLRVPDRGVLREGALADLLILPRHIPLSRATRSDVRLVLVNGAARYGDKDYAQSAAPAARWAPIRVDGRSKVLLAPLAEALWASGTAESGVEMPQATWRAA